MDFTVIILVFIIILQLAVIFMLYRSRAGAVDEKTLLNLCGILKQPNGACMKDCAICAANRRHLPVRRVWKTSLRQTACRSSWTSVLTE